DEILFFFSSRRRHTRFSRDWSSDVCSSDLTLGVLFMLFSTTLILPLAVSLVYRDGQAAHFSITFALAAAIGLAFWLPVRRRHSRSEERRVGNECLSRGATLACKHTPDHWSG